MRREQQRTSGSTVNASTSTQTDEGLWTGTLDTYLLSGNAPVILPAKNAWYISVVHQAAGTYVGLYERPVRPHHHACSGACSGAATLIDSPHESDGQRVFNLANANSGFGVMLLRQ
ncbi:hypothetical protein KQH60_06080 [Mycetohabitans sp. B8]|uniref:hypothetical protein n=1 Tax=Mycetohabitans sp. B8 TaxID=2841845 RepID=UPI001F3D119A|nr:hypothetical protein [Mycetohabitans sp. B8]MCG1042147.1 hypothetical protein [Mycetohabitans sp. B8]